MVCLFKQGLFFERYFGENFSMNMVTIENRKNISTSKVKTRRFRCRHNRLVREDFSPILKCRPDLALPRDSRSFLLPSNFYSYFS